MNARSHINKDVVDERSPLLTDAKIPVTFSMPYSPAASTSDGQFQPIHDDVVRLIASMLSIRDAVRFSLTNKRMRSVIMNALRVKEVKDRQTGRLISVPFIATHNKHASTYAQINAHLNKQHQIKEKLFDISNDAINREIAANIDADLVQSGLPRTLKMRYVRMTTIMFVILTLLILVPSLVVINEYNLSNNASLGVIIADLGVGAAGSGAAGYLLFRRAKRLEAQQSRLLTEVDNTLNEAESDQLEAIIEPHRAHSVLQ